MFSLITFLKSESCVSTVLYSVGKLTMLEAPVLGGTSGALQHDELTGGSCGSDLSTAAGAPLTLLIENDCLEQSNTKVFSSNNIFF